jgi:uncharacterized membrane protein YphA (DoxX/SURF4 family)
MLAGVNGAILLLLGFVFAAAALAKLASPDTFRATIRKLYGPRAAGLMTIAVPVAELLLAAWLISGASPRKAAAASVVVLLVFTAVLMRIWRKGLTCGCFGEASESAPAGMARNAVLIALAAWVAQQPETTANDGPWSLGAGMILGRWTLVIGAACAWACAAAVVRRRREVMFGASE